MTSPQARSPLFRAALAGVAPKVARQRTPHRLSDAFGPRSRASHRAPSGLAHTASIAIALCLFCVAYFAWQFAR